MAASSRLGRQITEIVAALDRTEAPAALIGGLALASHGVVRASQDVDILTDAGLANVLQGELHDYFRLFDRESLLDELLAELT